MPARCISSTSKEVLQYLLGGTGAENVRFVVDDEVTAIEGVPSAADEIGAVYTLNGQLIGKDIDVKSLPKGIYIMNGKKVSVK